MCLGAPHTQIPLSCKNKDVCEAVSARLKGHRDTPINDTPGSLSKLTTIFQPYIDTYTFNSLVQCTNVFQMDENNNRPMSMVTITRYANRTFLKNLPSITFNPAFHHQITMIS